jgi:hypothetical protein
MRKRKRVRMSLLVDDDGLGLNEIVNVPERDTESERREESDTEEMT